MGSDTVPVDVFSPQYSLLPRTGVGVSLSVINWSSVEKDGPIELIFST